MKIKFGDTDYFTLLELQKKLQSIYLDRLDLLALDKLRNEVHIKIKQIELEHSNTLKGKE